MKRNSLLFARVGAMMFACYLLLGGAFAQQPSPASVALGRELVELKGGAGMFDPIVVNVIEQTKGALLQTNPQLAKDLNDVSTQLRNEFAPRRSELINEAGATLTEATLRQVAAYNQPLLVKYLVLTNGLTNWCCEMDYENSNWQFVEAIPIFPAQVPK